MCVCMCVCVCVCVCMCVYMCVGVGVGVGVYVCVWVWVCWVTLCIGIYEAKFRKVTKNIYLARKHSGGM